VTFSFRKYENLWRNGDGNTYTRLWAKIRAIPPKYATRTATSLRGAEIMIIFDQKPSKGALRPQIRYFSAYFSLFGPYSPQFGEKSEKEELNNRFQSTPHKVRRPLNRDVGHKR
jgi:hypothetical protein